MPRKPVQKTANGQTVFVGNCLIASQQPWPAVRTGSVEAIRTMPGMAKTWSRPQTKLTNFGSESYSGMKPVVAGSSPAGREQTTHNPHLIVYGECSSVGRAPDCGSGRRGFKSHHSPHLFRPILFLFWLC